MAGVNVRMEVDASSFTAGINDAKESVKTLDEELKLNEKQLKAVGDAELYAKNKAVILDRQMEAQKQVVSGIQKQLEEMKSRGVDPSSTAYQKLERRLYAATGKMMDIQTQINGLTTSEADAAKEAGNLDTNVRNIGKGVAFNNLATGLKDITDKLESGARAAINFGKKVARSAMDSTEWADDILTRSLQNGIDAETLQRMENVAAYIDTDVDTILTAKSKLAKNKGNLGELLGIDAEGRTIDEVFWEAGKAIMAMTDEFEKEEAAQKIFGRGWKELVPLFTAGQETYDEMLAQQTVLTNEQVQKLGEADDKFQEMEIELQRLKNEFWAENSQTIIGLLQWLLDNKEAVVIALGAIGGAFAMLKVGELAIDIKKVVDGFKTIKGLGGGGGGGAPVVTGGGGGGAPTVTGGGKGFWATLGSWVTDAAGMSGAGLVGGTAVSAAIVYFGSKAIADINDAANKAREVSADAEHFDKVFAEYVGTNTGAQRGIVGGPTGDKRRVLQSTVRALLGTTGGSKYAYDELKYLGYNLNKDIFEAFNYTNTSGESRNKLLDMLDMNGDLTPATAALVLKSAGIDVNDPRLKGYSQAYQSGLVYLQNNGYEMKKNGGFSEGLSIIEDFFMKNGTFDENGLWSIPSLLEEEAAKSNEAAEKMSAAAESLQTLPETTAAAVKEAVSGVKVSVNLMDLFSFRTHANGIWSVPWDGYPAILHRGERVLTAGEANRYTTNNYFGNVNLNNGLEIEQLTESIDRRNRRQMAGYGAA